MREATMKIVLESILRPALHAQSDLFLSKQALDVSFATETASHIIVFSLLQLAMGLSDVFR